MSKVISNEKITFKDILKKARFYGKKFICLLITLFFLGSYGCGPKAKNEDSKTTSEPKTNAQLSNDTSIAVAGGNSESPSVSPVEPSFITPNPTEEPIKNEYFVFFPSEEELMQLETEAAELKKKLKTITYGENEALALGNCTVFDIVKVLSGDFSDVKSGTLEAEIAFNIAYNLENGYIITIRNCGDKIGNKDAKGIKIVNPEFSNIFAIAGFEKYAGAETLKFFEDEADRIYNLGIKDNNSEEYMEKADEIISIIEKIIFRENDYSGKNLTDFYEMHPLVKHVFLMYAYAVNGFIAFSMNQEENQDLLNRIIKIDDAIVELRNNGYLKEETLNLIDAYLAIAEQGTYDAYMSGDETRKKTIKELMLNNDKIKLY